MSFHEAGISPIDTSYVTDQSVSVSKEPGYLTPEYVRSLVPYTNAEPDTRHILVACSDDRNPTDESAVTLQERYPSAIPVNEGYGRIFGGKYGIPPVLGATAVAIGNPTLVESADWYTTLATDVSEVNERTTLAHSAIQNESHPSECCPHSSGALGCLFCMKAGAAVMLLVGDDNIKGVAYEDQQRIFGETASFDRIMEGFGQVAEAMARGKAGNAAEFAIGRKDIAGDIANGAVMILDGEHAPVARTGLLQDFRPNAYSNPTFANANGQPFYHATVGTAVEKIARWSVEQGVPIDFGLLMRATVGLSTSVRAALAATESSEEIPILYDPRKLAVGWVGDPHETADFLRHSYAQ